MRGSRSWLLALALGSTGFVCTDDDPGAPVWPTWGGDLENTHHARGETAIDPTTVAGLHPIWVVETSGNVSAIPTLSETRLYVTDWGPPIVGGSHLYAIDRADGSIVLDRKVIHYSGNLLNAQSRSSPAITEDRIVFGDSRNQPSSLLGIPGAHGAALYAVDRRTGGLVWKTILDPHPLAIVTQSPVIHDGTVFVGVSSYEEAAAQLGGYPCCTFRGSMLAVDLETGAIEWKRWMTDPGFSGAAVWGSAPTIDVARNAVYIATGNNYTFPADLEACVSAQTGNPSGQQACYDELDSPTNFTESVLALDLDTGEPHWTRKLQNYGAWNFACDPDLVPWLPDTSNCQDLTSLDFDFGQAPMLVGDRVLVGQKSGVFWAFDADDGSTLWATRVGPGGVLGGMEFGAATDGERVYTQITNFEHTEFELVAGAHAGELARGGIWAALDVATGELLWQTPDPSSDQPLDGSIVHPTWGAGLGPGFFATAMGPMTVANGVVFAGSMDREGHMHALDAATGEILWSFASGGSVMSAPSIDGGVVYWGSGYSTGFDNAKLFAFGL